MQELQVSLPSFLPVMFLLLFAADGKVPPPTTRHEIRLSRDELLITHIPVETSTVRINREISGLDCSNQK